MKRIRIVVAALIVTACADSKPAQPPQKLTQHERDSIDRVRHQGLSKSGIPGAQGVGKAMKAADNESRRINALDTIH